MPRIDRPLAAVPALVLASVSAFAGEYAVEPLPDGPPPDLAGPVRAALAPAARVLEDGRPRLDLWLRRDAPLLEATEELAVKFTPFAPGLLVGAVRFHAAGADFRGQKVAAGVYTLRYAVQPEDGDHQGVSDTKDYLLLASAARDATPDDLPPEQLVKLSAAVAGKKHPVALYLVKGAGDGPAPGLVHDEANERWLIELTLPRTDAAAKAPRLGLVIAGRARE